MGARAQSARDYNVPIDYFVGKLRAVGGAGLNLEFKSENPAPGGVWYRIHHGATAISWGEKITVTLTDLGGATRVDVLSECALPTQIVDYGKNKSNVNVIFEFLDRDVNAYLASYQPQTAQPQYAPQTAQPQYAPQPAPAPQANPFKFCWNCGTKLAADANFCSACGAKLG